MLDFCCLLLLEKLALILSLTFWTATKENCVNSTLSSGKIFIEFSIFTRLSWTILEKATVEKTKIWKKKKCSFRSNDVICTCGIKLSWMKMFVFFLFLCRCEFSGRNMYCGVTLFKNAVDNSDKRSIHIILEQHFSTFFLNQRPLSAQTFCQSPHLSN